MNERQEPVNICLRALTMQREAWDREGEILQFSNRIFLLSFLLNELFAMDLH